MRNRMAPGSAPDKPPKPSSIQFGCFTAVPLITFLLVAVTVLSFLAYDKHLRTTPLEKLKPAERADFEHWSALPIDINAARADAAPSPQLQQRKRDFNRRTNDVYEGALDIFESSPTLYKKYKVGEYLTPAEQRAMQDLSPIDRLRRGEQLSTTETALLAERTAPIATLLDEARRLTADPAYTAYSYPFDYGIEAGLSEQLFTAYALVSAHQQAWPQALDSLKILVEIFRVPDEMALRSYYAYHVKNTASFLEDHTSDTANLSAILTALNRAREIALRPATPLTFLRPSGIRMLIEMRETGYITRYPKTLGEALALRAMERDYGNYLVDVLPPTDPRHMSAVAKNLISSMSDSNRDIALARMHTGILKPAARRLQLSAKTAHVAAMITNDADDARDITRALVEFDLARIALARRIMRLRGDTETTASASFVPELLPKIPVDLYSGKELQYDAEKDSYYSVGPDGAPGGGDDIYHRPYKPPAVPGLPDIMY